MRFYIFVYILLVRIVIRVSCDCGIAAPRMNPPILDEDENEVDIFPWHVQIYEQVSINSTIRIYAGTLISSDVVITAAKYFYDAGLKKKYDARRFIVAACEPNCGNHDNMGRNIQKSIVETIHLPNGYQGYAGLERKEIAWLVLQHPFNLTSSVGPICIDLHNRQNEEELQRTEVGEMMYWQYSRDTMNEIFVKMKITAHSYNECSSMFPVPQSIDVTDDKFCDIFPKTYQNFFQFVDGGGFYSRRNDRWYLRGVIIKNFIHPYNSEGNVHLLFTNVGHYIDEINRSGAIRRCGIATISVSPMIVEGFRAQLGRFPWHVAIYRQNSTGFYEQICAGSLISSNVVVSAAHCFYDDIRGRKQDASSFAVAAGKHYRHYNWPEISVQKSAIETIHLPIRYQGVDGLYAGDIAWLILQHPFHLSTLVTPICIDLDNSHEREDFRSGRVGKVVGWGRTAAGHYSNELQETNLPFIPYEECIPTFTRDFKPFVTSDKFCAGYTNGTRVCDGDSGGGLAFQRNGRWYLRGIVSVGPPSGDTCNSYSYTVFTNVGHFIDELHRFTNITTYDLM